MFWWKLWEMVVVTHRSASWSKKEWKWWRNEHKIFFFTLFQNFMVPLDSSWWDLFKSALAPQFTICPPVCFGTYLWIFFIFTSVPILKKSCCRKNQIFAQNHLPSQWFTHCVWWWWMGKFSFIFWSITIIYVERILHCTRHVEKIRLVH